MDFHECKVIFKPDTTRDQAEEVVRRYHADAKFDNFYEKRQVGCNEVTFGIITLPTKSSERLNDDSAIMRIEVMTTFKTNKSCETGGCGNC